MKTKLLIISFVLILTLCGCTKPHARSDMSGSTALSGEKAVPAGEKAQSVSSVTTMPPSAQTPVPRSAPTPTAAPSSNLNNVKYTTYKSELYGFTVDIPSFLKRDTSSDTEDIFISDDKKTKIVLSASDSPLIMYDYDFDIDLMYDEVLSDIKYEPNYTSKQSDWFVISWDTPDTVFYLKYYLKSTGEDNKLVFSYPKSEEKSYDDIVTHVSQSFKTGKNPFNEAEFVYFTKNALNVPSDLNVTYELDDEYYWDAGECYLRNITFYHGGKKIAGASFDTQTYEMVNNIYVYTP